MSDSRYKLPSFEKGINRFIGFVFYYRLVFVLIALIAIIVGAYIVAVHSSSGEKLRNASLFFTGGTIIIGIFYSIINYEHNQLKFKHDVKTSREVLTFTVASKMYDKEMITHFKNVKTFYLAHKELFVQNQCSQIAELFKADADIRLSYIVIFNYLEAISTGIEQGIMDEVFMKEFFKTLFRDYASYFGSYIEYERKESKSPRIFKQFSAKAEIWNKDI